MNPESMTSGVHTGLRLETVDPTPVATAPVADISDFALYGRSSSAPTSYEKGSRWNGDLSE
jgi:hypothetical protein